MSIDGSGRFQRRRDSDVSAVSGQSIHSNFSTAQQRQPPPEPGTGAAFMAQQGWSQRDTYGRPLRGNSSGAAAPQNGSQRLLPPTPMGILAAGGVGGGLLAGKNSVAPLPLHRVKFNRERRYEPQPRALI